MGVSSRWADSLAVGADTTCTAARWGSSAASAFYSREQRGAVCGVRQNFQNYIKWIGNKITILCQLEHQKIPPHPKYPSLEKHFISSRNPMFLLAATINIKVISLTCPVCGPHSRFVPPRRDRGCQNTALDVPFAYVCRSALSREQWRQALSKLEMLLRLHS